MVLPHISPKKSWDSLSLCGCEGLSSKSSNKLLSFPLMRRASPDPIGMLVCSLSGLRSLTNLNLSYCNLWTIPNALGCLSSLKGLNLRGNNFVSLPKSIVQLSNLYYLLLDNCIRLQSLPELPSNMVSIQASGFTSLEILPLRQECSFMPTFSLFNCLKLVENQGYSEIFLTMVRSYIQF